MRTLILILGMSIGVLPAFAEPLIYDDGVIVETYVSGIPDSPTSMAFIGNDVLVLQRYNGQVRLIEDGVMRDRPVLDVSVAKDGERGMLGITTVGSTVYLYFTAADTDGGKAIENRIYKYTWNGQELVDPVLLKTLPSENFYHNGGAMTSFDGHVYAVIGDNGNYGRLQNRPFDWKNDTSVILRVDPPGPYYAIGVRNSFGITVDPITGNLWDTENGDDENDEINFVPDKFNSGWIEIMGPAKDQAQIDALPQYEDYVYSDPEFTWQRPVAPTGISFLKSDTMKSYEDTVFVGDCNTGSIYKFKLNQDRTGFVFETPELSDNVLNIGDPADEIIFGTGFGCVTDIEAGPDGLLYFVSLSEGKIFRMLPNVLAEGANSQSTANEPEGGGCLIATAAYGTEMAAQVQMLRETRGDVSGTSSGAAFLTGFNQFYYSFSPTISDMERQNPAFKEAVRVAITPMISTLSILNYADVDSESEVLGYGIGVILLNVGMYVAMPAIVIVQVGRMLRK